VALRVLLDLNDGGGEVRGVLLVIWEFKSVYDGSEDIGVELMIAASVPDLGEDSLVCAEKTGKVIVPAIIESFSQA